MKKLPLIGLIALLGVGGLAACGESGSDTSENASSSIVSEVIITGSHNVTVGRTINLTASTAVTWSSLNADIATVDASGVVTGVSKGEATIRATSTSNTSIYADWEVSVSPVVPESINISIEGEGLISQDGDTYTLQVGKSVVASVDSDPSFDTSYTISYSDQNYSGSIDTENISNTSVRLTPNRVVSGVTLVFKIFYGADNASSKQDSVILNVEDPNSEAISDLEEELATTLADEKTSLKSATITKTVKLGDSLVSEDTYKYSSYSDATYLTVSDETEASTHYFSGIRDNNYYLFAYDPSDSNFIDNIYQTVASTDASYATYEENAKLLFDPSGSITYGLGSMIAKLFDGSSTLPLDFVNFGDSTAYNSMVMVESSGKTLIASTFTEDGADYSLNFEVEIASGRIASYSFEETYTSSEGTYSYIETISDLVYEAKVVDSSANNSNYLSFDAYYFTESLEIFDLSGTKDEDGRYDYSDTSKFGGAVSVGSDGNAYYRVPYNKSLPLRVTGGNPLIDAVTITPSNAQIDVPSLVAGGIYSFSAKEGDDHVMTSGTTSFTFTSAKNKLSKTITIEFYIPSVTELNASNNPANNDFGQVYRGDVSSSYIYLNAEPDTSTVSFEIVDETGSNVLTGIEIYNYASDNVDGYPSYGYFVKGNVNGTYKFKFRVVGTSVVTDDTFTVTVVDPISAEAIKQGIVTEKPTYVYKTSTATTTVKFTSETELTLSYVSTGVDEITEKVAYHIEEGHIVIDVASDGSNYAFKEANFYYKKILAGNIRFASDFSTITLYLSFGDSADAFSPVVLSKDRSAEINYDNLASYLNGKTLTANSTSQLSGYGGMWTASVSFTATSGTLTLTKADNSETITFTFDYVYDASAKSLTYSNFTSTVDSLSLASNTSNLRSSDNTLNFTINFYNSEYGYNLGSTFSISLLA